MAASNSLYNNASLAPAAGSLTTLYTVPADYRITLKVFVCNRGAATTFRLSVAGQGAADALSQYIYYDTVLPANDSLEISRLTLTQADQLRGSGLSANVSFVVLVEEVQMLTNL